MPSPLTSDISGDTVRIDPPELAVNGPPWYLCLYLLILPLILAATDSTRSFADGVFSITTLVLMSIMVGVLVIWECYGAYKRWLIPKLVGSQPDDTLSGAALRTWCDAVTSHRTFLPFDTDQWIRRTGPHGPRLITIECAPPEFQLPSDTAEAVDMGSGRPLAKSERYSMWLMVGMAVFFMGMPLLMRTAPLNSRMLFMPAFLFWGGYSLWALNRLGLRLVSFTAAVATPGRLEIARFGREIDFTREDSVLVLQKIRNQNRLVATFVRRDRRSYTIQFQGGSPHPALVQLLSRWCYRAPSAPLQES